MQTALTKNAKIRYVNDTVGLNVTGLKQKVPTRTYYDFYILISKGHIIGIAES